MGNYECNSKSITSYLGQTQWPKRSK
jgi:hypothetical protein